MSELVTVVVPARNEQRCLGRCLDSVLAQDYPHLQVLVVDGMSTDDTAEVVKHYANHDPRVELLVNPDEVIPKSLNLAVAASRGRWLVRVDAHATVRPDYVRRAVEHLRTGRWAGVGGRKDGVGRTPAGRAVSAAMASRFGVGNSTYHYGTDVTTVEHIPFGAYDLRVVRQVGGWDERLRVNQDFEFDYRLRKAGYELLFDPSMVIDWECRQSIRELYRQYHRYGRGKVEVAWLHPRSVRARHLAAPALVATVAASALLAVQRPLGGAGLVAPYVAALGAASVQVARRLPDQRGRWWVAPAFLAMHVGWGVGAWQGFASKVVTGARRRTSPVVRNK